MSYFKSPKEMYRNLKIHRSVINKQLQCLDYGFQDLKSQLRRYLAFVDLEINDYEEFFRKQRNKQQQIQLQLFIDD